jgi:hypothetical protein
LHLDFFERRSAAKELELAVINDSQFSVGLNLAIKQIIIHCSSHILQPLLLQL